MVCNTGYKAAKKDSVHSDAFPEEDGVDWWKSDQFVSGNLHGCKTFGHKLNFYAFKFKFAGSEGFYELLYSGK